MTFAKGHKLSTGRPKGAKNTLPIIRDRLFKILLRRLTHDKDLASVDTATLIKFASACLPKDMTLAVSKPPEITYISQVPRPNIEYVPINVDKNNEDTTQLENGNINQPIESNEVIDNKEQ